VIDKVSETLSREKAFALFPELQRISPELTLYADLLRRWQAKINLVAPNTLGELWLRHFADSAQVQAAAPEARIWVDLGSGAGFPGLVTALLLKGKSGATVHLIESDQRKGAFLRAVSRETSAPAQIHIGRIETVLPELEGSIEAVSARALAPLSDLLRLTANSIEKGAKGVFLKGEDWREELTPLEPETNFFFSTIDSRTHPRSRLILVAARR
jgi:16S rRNA (guanine527-N7)-methyltransferase